MKNFEDGLYIAQVLVFGNRSAFDKLVLKYQSQIRRFLLYLCNGNKDLSDDLAQDTFLKAYLQLNQFNSFSQFSTWLFRIAFNVFYDECRKRKINENELTSTEFCDKTIDAEDKILSLSYDLSQALSLLNQSEKNIVLLYYMEDFSLQDIVKITHLSINTVKSHLFRAREKMKLFLIHSGYEK